MFGSINLSDKTGLGKDGRSAPLSSAHPHLFDTDIGIGTGVGVGVGI